MEYIVKHIPIKAGKRSGRNMKPTSLTIHSTANKSSTAMNERNWLVNPSNTRVASWHVVVDDKMAVEAIPFNEPSIHAGNGTGNTTSIGLEICESGNRTVTINNAVKLSAKILNERGWGISKLVRHYDWSGKICPGIFSANGWKLWVEFKVNVKKEMDKLDKPVKKVVPDVKVEVAPKPLADWEVSGREYVMKHGISDGTDPRGIPTRAQVWSMIERMNK